MIDYTMYVIYVIYVIRKSPLPGGAQRKSKRRHYIYAVTVWVRAEYSKQQGLVWAYHSARTYWYGHSSAALGPAPNQAGLSA